MNKYLIIRLSSFGDIVQTLSAADKIYTSDPKSEIHWLTRNDFGDFITHFSNIKKVWQIQRKSGIRTLLTTIIMLHKYKFTHLYDAHNNIRSNLITFFLKILNPKLKVKRRSKNRIKRILLFKFRINKFPQPFIGAFSFVEPIRDWIQNLEFPQPTSLQFLPTKLTTDLQFEDYVILAPGAAWELKRWPTTSWIQLINESPQQKYILLGGTNDTFCEEIALLAKEQVINLSGKLDWVESCSAIAKSKLIISGDTGLMHFADRIGTPAIVLIGPSAFGYPMRKTSVVIESTLSCKPCSKDGRGKCHNKEYKKCMNDITPKIVEKKLSEIL